MTRRVKTHAVHDTNSSNGSNGLWLHVTEGFGSQDNLTMRSERGEEVEVKDERGKAMVSNLIAIAST